MAELADCAKARSSATARRSLSYGSTLGYGPLREWLAERHGVEPGAGAGHERLAAGVPLRARRVQRPRAGARRAPDLRPAAEDPRRGGDRARRVAVDDEGLDVDELERELDGPPASVPLHDPDLPEPDRLDAVRGAPPQARRARRASDELPVLEDDPVRACPLRGRAAADRCSSSRAASGSMYSSSFSKTIAPGLRVGYAIVPAALTGELEELVASTYITPALLTQATVYEFLRRGLFEPNLERVCAAPRRGATRCSMRSSGSSRVARAGTGPRAATSSGSTCPRDRRGRAARGARGGRRDVRPGHRLRRSAVAPPGLPSASSRRPRSTRACDGWPR